MVYYLQMEDLIPLPGYVLVELTESVIANIELPDKQYSTKTSGIIVAIPPSPKGTVTVSNGLSLVPSMDEFIGKKVYFEAYKDDVKEVMGDREFAFIDVKDIRGYAKSS